MSEESIRKKIKQQMQMLNTFENLVDPAKDAKISFQYQGAMTKLEEDIHGPFLIAVYKQLFNSNILPAGASPKLKGIGDGLGKVLREIEKILGNNLTTFSYDYSSLGYSADGDSDWRMHEMNFIIDTPIDLDRIGDKTCKAVVGPFSILDRAPRTMTYPKERLVDLLAYSSTLPEAFLQRIGMDKSLDAISYEKEAASYKFTFALKPFFTSPDLPQQKVIRFDSSFKTTDGYVLDSTNSVRNEIVYRNYRSQDPRILNKILFLTLFKELGDTLQATWILQYIQDEELPDLGIENTAVVSVDRGVLYRAVINGVGCLYTNHGAQCSNYYPRIGRPFKAKHGPLAGQVVDSDLIRKRSLFQSLIANNNSVLSCLRTVIKAFEKAKRETTAGRQANISVYDWADSFETMGLDPAIRKQRESMNVDIILMLVKSMMNYILPITQHIESEMDRLVTSDEENPSEFVKKVVNYKLAAPFADMTFNFLGGEDKLRWSKSFTQFLKEPVVGLEKDGTNVFDLYNLSLLYKKVPPTREQLGTIVFSEATPQAQWINIVPIIWQEPVRLAPAMVDEASPGKLAGKKARRGRGDEEDNNDKSEKKTKPTEESQGGGGSDRFKKLFTQNKRSPNFLLFFLLTYSPEFFALACAYELSAYSSSDILDKYKDVFSTAKTVPLCSGYRDVDEHYLYDYSELEESGSKHSPGKSMNSLCTHACAVLKMVFQHKTKEPTELLNMARKKSPEIVWLIENLNDYFTLPSVHLNMGDKLFHWDAACYYQQIFDADVNLCIVNQRSKKNPLDDVVIFKKIESVKAGPNTPPRLAVRKHSSSTKKIHRKSSSSQKRRNTHKQPFHNMRRTVRV